jgi:two-component system, chemotaxis family, response regulator Rcp1
LQPLIIVVEDNPTDVFLVKESVRAARLDVLLKVAEDSEEAIKLIAAIDADESGHCPQLILLDINLPRASGFEVLQHIRQSARCKSTPVIVMTSSAAPADRAKASELGANGYFWKPSQYDEFMKLGDLMRNALSDA